MNKYYKIPMFDLRVTDQVLMTKLKNAFETTLSHGMVMLGPEVQELEKRICKIIKTQFAVGVGSGSSAIYLALRASGINQGDEVIVSPMTWIITVNAIAACGAIPVFADINDDFNIDPKSIKNRINKKTKAILTMHYAGKLCDMTKITKLAKENELLIIEDAAQAFGSSMNGVFAGNFSTAASFSFNPMKTLGGYGEAGIVVTNNEEIYERVKRLRHAGTNSDPRKFITNDCVEVSLNHKIDTINASFLLIALDELDKKMTKRHYIASSLNKRLTKKIRFQKTKKDEVHSRYVYPIITDKRDDLKRHLENNGIETKVMHYPLACDAQVYRKYNNYPLPKSYELINKNLILPSHEKLNENDLDYLINTVNAFF